MKHSKFKLFKYYLISFPFITFASNVNGAEIGLGRARESSIYYSKHKVATNPFLALDLSLGNFYMRGTAGISEIGYEQSFTDNFSVSLFVNPFDGFSIKGKDLLPGYQSIQTRKTQFAFGWGLNYNLGGLFGLNDTFISLEGKSGKRGASSNVSLLKSFNMTKNWKVSPYIGSSYYSSKYTDYYFGIKQSELGNKITSVYKPKAAYATHIGINTDYAFTNNLGMGLSVGWNKYSKEIKQSPIIKRDSQFTSSLSLYYKF